VAEKKTFLQIPEEDCGEKERECDHSPRQTMRTDRDEKNPNIYGSKLWKEEREAKRNKRVTPNRRRNQREYSE